MSAVTARDLSESLAGVAESCGGSVVRVHASRSPASGVVWSADGIVVAANHKVEWDEGVQLTLSDGRTVAASVVGRDPSIDVAVLRSSVSGLPAAAWSREGSAGASGDNSPTDSAASVLKVGHLVLSLSRPGRSIRAGLGIVCALGETWRTPAGGRVDRYVQTDVGLHTGFSGSLLVDLDGQGLGMNTAGIHRNLALTVPVPTLDRVVRIVLAHGHVRRGFIGVSTYPVRVPKGSDPEQTTALLVLSVQPDSPAAKAGLVLGDALLAMEGHPLTNPGELLALLEEERIGVETSFRILRAGSPQDVKITIGTRGARGAQAS